MLKTVSWIVLTIAGAGVLIASLASLRLAYTRGQEQYGAASLASLAAGREDVATALHSRRATAAGFAAGFAVLFLAIILGPYRAGSTWAWWALLAGAATVAALSSLRVVFLDTSQGVPPAVILFVITLVALLLDVGRLKSGR